MREAAEGSLKRLRVDRIDVYQLHAPDSVAPFHASVETLAELQAEGKIRFVALSNVTQEHVERARKIVPIVSVQNRYSFANREWDDLVEYCEREGIGFIPFSPLAAGTVAGMVLENTARAENAQAGCARLAAEAFTRNVPIPGTSSIQHLEENVAAASLQLSDEESQELANIPE